MTHLLEIAGYPNYRLNLEVKTLINSPNMVGNKILLLGTIWGTHLTFITRQLIQHT